jgi:peptidoglycan/LPS O-acetylase OafA/YrhL
MKPGLQSRAGSQDGSYCKALDGLRAVSILMVLFHHAPKYSPQHPLHTLQENCRYGVAFFFVISGFLICTLFLREEENNGRIDLWRFYGRRALRLFPLYYAALLLQAVLVFALKLYTPENQALFAEKLPAYLFYYSNWLPTATTGPFFQAWSLAVEEQFYLVFGFLLCFAGRRAVVGAALAALFVKFLAYQAFGAIDANSTAWRVIFSYQEPVLFGVLMAFALNTKGGREILPRWLRPTWALTAAGAATAAWLCLHPMRTQSSWDAQFLYALMTLVMVCLVVRPATPVLSGRFMAHLGRISYGIYLLHMFVITVAKKAPGGTSPVLCFLYSAIAAGIVASLVYEYFERPIILFYKKKLSPPNAGAPVFPAATQEPRLKPAAAAVQSLAASAGPAICPGA